MNKTTSWSKERLKTFKRKIEIRKGSWPIRELNWRSTKNWCKLLKWPTKPKLRHWTTKSQTCSEIRFQKSRRSNRLLIWRRLSNWPWLNRFQFTNGINQDFKVNFSKLSKLKPLRSPSMKNASKISRMTSKPLFQWLRLPRRHKRRKLKKITRKK